MAPTILAVFLTLCLMMAVAGDAIPAGRALHRLMVDRPAAALNRVTSAHLIIASVFIALLVLAICCGENDAIRLLGFAAPDLTAWLTTVEISACIDTIAAAAVAVSGMRSLVRHRLSLATVLPVAGRRDRKRPRSIRRKATAIPANDDEDGPAFALAG